MLRCTLPLLAVLLANLAQAQTNIYNASAIPDSLKKGAHSVVREYKQELIVSGLNKTTLRSHEVITVLDEQAGGELMFRAYSSAFRRLEDAEVKVYDGQGNQLKRIRQKDMATRSYGSELVDDGLFTYFEVAAPAYPITVEYNSTIVSKGMMNYPTFYVEREERAIQQASLSVTMPPDITLRHFNHLLSLEPAIQTLPGGSKLYTWQVSNLTATPEEKGTGDNSEPNVLLAPAQFEMDDRPGDMSTWASFGQWMYDLNKESMTLPPASQQFYKNMTASATTDEEKIRLIYRYLQKNFRYVAIEQGIDGYRSFPASFTEQKKYGDCKGLSTYMKACLDAVGIKSYTALINAEYNSEPVDPAFPHNGFNHVILCVPQAKDTIWLECTNKNADFGILGNFTENRNALLLTEKGGVLVPTPASKAIHNTESMYTLVTLADDGSGKATVSLTGTGECRMEEMSALYEESKDDQKRYLVSYRNFIQPDDFEVNMKGFDSSELHSDLRFAFEKVPAFMAGTKMFIAPRLYHLWNRHLPAAEKRASDFFFEYPFIIKDTTVYQLPEGYTIDNLPAGKTFTCPYGAYTSSYWYDEAKKQVFTSGRLELAQYRIPAKDYLAVAVFFNMIVADETQKIVVKK